MAYRPGLLLALSAFWIALSGETSPLFLMLGALSVLLTLWLAARLKIVGRDASPWHRALHMLVYAVWLAGQVVKSNMAVIRKILGPAHAIDPVMVNVTTTARTDLGKALFANSITLTPPWYHPCTMMSRPGTGISPPLCDTQFSSAVCADGSLKYAR